MALSEEEAGLQCMYASHRPSGVASVTIVLPFDQLKQLF